MEAAAGWPCRLLWHHGFPGRADHVDCLIRDSESDLGALWLPAGFAAALLALPQPARQDITLKALDTAAGVHCWPAEAAPRHRNLYWSYAGSVAGGRGFLSEIGRGRLHGWPAASAWICLSLPAGTSAGH